MVGCVIACWLITLGVLVYELGDVERVMAGRKRLNWLDILMLVIGGMGLGCSIVMTVMLGKIGDC